MCKLVARMSDGINDKSSIFKCGNDGRERESPLTMVPLMVRKEREGGIEPRRWIMFQ